MKQYSSIFFSFCLLTTAVACGGVEDETFETEDEIFGAGGGGTPAACYTYGTYQTVSPGYVPTSGARRVFCKPSSNRPMLATVNEDISYEIQGNYWDEQGCHGHKYRVSVYGMRNNTRNFLGTSGWQQAIFTPPAGGFYARCDGGAGVQIDADLSSYDRIEVIGHAQRYPGTNYQWSYYDPEVKLHLGDVPSL